MNLNAISSLLEPQYSVGRFCYSVLTALAKFNRKRNLQPTPVITGIYSRTHLLNPICLGVSSQSRG